MKRPEYFDPIREGARRRWEQLEKDPELAGPWHLLFNQIQSPRHILSELLQNADDAGATEANVNVDNQVFIFEHNGADFSPDDFASLCRFGYSNKRVLHTIGFRGIGFKSTFSLGDNVELCTPTLAVRFNRSRFTEPHWLPDRSLLDGKTCVRVAIKDHYRQREVEKNLADWFNSPVSLLFFKNIRRLKIGEHLLHWERLGPGPVPDSELVALDGKKAEALLLLRTKAEEFPPEALAEIKQERMLGIDEYSDFPPCKIEILLGVKGGRLFVVLPTGVETELPFACNAPFIQDPARLKIKDPDISPTNRWLLERTGKLAASAMLAWLDQSEIPLVKRAAAYALLPDVDRENSTLDGSCGTIVEESFAASVKEQHLLLSYSGKLVSKSECIIIPNQVLEVWPGEKTAALLDEQKRPPLCPDISKADRQKLLNWGMVEQIDKRQFVTILTSKRLPKPDSWWQLLKLWSYIAPEITGYRHYVQPKDLRIIPAQGKADLCAATDVVRLGEKRLLQSHEDWEYLSAYLLVMNPQWVRFLAEQHRTAKEEGDTVARENVDGAYEILKKTNLAEASDANKMIELVAGKFFSRDSITLQDSIRISQIAAKLGATVGQSFRFVTRDGDLRGKDDNILFDNDGSLEELLYDDFREEHLLHNDYSAKYISCSRDEWFRWALSGRSGLLTFIPISQQRTSIYGKPQVERLSRERGLTGELRYHYVTSRFIIEDWNFEEPCWDHWQALAKQDEHHWARVAGRILSQPKTYWNHTRSIKLYQVATTGSEKEITYESLLPSWVIRLRSLPCLRDQRNFPRQPSDLLRRTPQTEALLEVEPFVHATLDTESSRPLLDLLGVRSTPTGPDRILDCLRTLALADSPPGQEVDKWYRRLDSLIENCSTEDFEKVGEAFRKEKLILSADGGWDTSAAVFHSTGEEKMPGIAVVRPSVVDLTFWHRIGLAERPTAEMVIRWLAGLPSGQALAPENAQRIGLLLRRYPHRIWDECGHWLNLAGEWMPVSGLAYKLTMQSLTPWSHMYPWVKQKTANFKDISEEIANQEPFKRLQTLADLIEERFARNPNPSQLPEQKNWLTTFGAELKRITLQNSDETMRIRAWAERLASTKWYTSPELEIIPYIDGTPAGSARLVDVVWFEQELHVKGLPKAKLAKLVPEEIGKTVARGDIRAALAYSFERSPEDIREYLEVNFKLEPPASTAKPAKSTDDIDSPDPQNFPSTKTNALESEPITVSGGDEGQNEDFIQVRSEFDDGNVSDSSADDGLGPATAQGETSTRPHKEEKPPRPSIIERFAKEQGLTKDANGRFVHTDGSWLGKTSRDAQFPWEKRASNGDLVRYYWPKDHCLELRPLEIKAEVWGAIDQHPERYSFLLASPQEEGAVEITGSRLLAMLDSGNLILYPATYRLVFSQDI